MKTDPFVNIKTFFNDNIARDYSCLCKQYHDENYLVSAIQDLIGHSIDFNNKSVLLKPNWVLHERRITDEYALCTHPNLILALTKYILNNYIPTKITIGDAPLQDCIWDKLIKDDFKEEITKLSTNYKVPICIKDYRRVSLNFKKNKLTENKSPITDYLLFDVGKESALEPITHRKTKFRVTNYNPARMKEAHSIGVHKYCITKDFFEHDLVITLPKIKTHQKAGITGALKILVGINGDKDFLPHHRKGGDKLGGDCYPGGNPLKYMTESFLDVINRFRGKFLYETLRTGAFAFWKYILLTPTHYLGAGWYGNDTCWRMVSDLNKIARFGSKDGKIHTERQREVYSLSDGIIGGQGNGPLNPQPLHLGVLIFSNEPLLNDLVISRIMKLNSNKIPIIKEVKPEQIKNCTLKLNKEIVSIDEIDMISIDTEPSPGWELLLQE
ncbi:MAG: DUF362 domain-containing protein [Bacteroidales bacterium]|jgi:uncharacterized protein (DUF362 family)